MDKMNIYLVFFVLVCSKDIWCNAHAIGAEVQNMVKNDDKIVGGIDTDIEIYPYQAYLLLYDGRDYYECGGSIISENYVVTAAHCLPRIRLVQIRIGSTNKNSGGNTYNSSTFYPHPLYNDRTFEYDVGIVNIAESMVLDGYHARAIPLATFGNDPDEFENMTITGWGNTAEGGSSSENLKVAQVPVVYRETCNEQLGGGVTSRMFCAGYEEGGIDTCQAKKLNVIYFTD